MMRYKNTCLVDLVVPSTSVPNRSHSGDSLKMHNVSDNEDTLDSSCSGILINEENGYVLTHSTILAPYLCKKIHPFEKLLRDGLLVGHDFKSWHVTVTLETTASSQLDYESLDSSRNQKYYVSMLNCAISKDKTESKLHKYKATIQQVWKVPSFEKAVNKLMPKTESWKFYDNSPEMEESKLHNNRDKSVDPEIDPEKIGMLLPYFVLVKLCDWQAAKSGLKLASSSHLKTGQNVIAVGTPFGNLSPEVFINSVSKGTICNVAGHNNVLILTDARCIPGSEGGALYVKHNKKNSRDHLAGIVVAPLCWKANEWIGLTIACGISEILDSLQQTVSSFPATAQVGGETDLKSLLSAIVMVRCGYTWGTGIIVDPTQGLILTCGHVVKHQQKGQVEVRLSTSDSGWHKADIVYAAQCHAVFDVALLRLNNTSQLVNTGQIRIDNSCVEGSDVTAIGYALFGDRHQMAPSVTSGVVSKVVSISHIPIIIQSSCAVHCGGSGGPLVSSSGQILGIVICNARDSATGASYPHVNLSVPMSTIWPVINKYIKTRDPGVLKQLHIKNPVVHQLWNLNHTGAAVEKSNL